MTQRECPECSAFEATNPSQFDRLMRDQCSACWQAYLEGWRKAGEELSRQQSARVFRLFHVIGRATSLEQARIDVLEIHPELKRKISYAKSISAQTNQGLAAAAKLRQRRASRRVRQPLHPEGLPVSRLRRDRR